MDGAEAPVEEDAASPLGQLVKGPDLAGLLAVAQLVGHHAVAQGAVRHGRHPHREVFPEQRGKVQVQVVGQGFHPSGHEPARGVETGGAAVLAVAAGDLEHEAVVAAYWFA